MSEIQDAIQQICEEKNISVESVLETIEAALAAAYRKDFGNKMQNIHVDYDLAANKMDVFDVKTVVEDMDLEELEKQREEFEAKKEAGEEVDEEELKRFNPKTEIMLAEAKELDAKAKIDKEIKTKLEVPDEFGRMAAQTAKQVIIQRLREAERETIFNEYKEKEGEVFNVIVQRREGRNVYCDINKAMAVIPPEEQAPIEQYTSGQRLKVVLLSVNQSPKGPEIIISRVHPDLLKELFKTEVPEIAAGTVEIKSVSREAGSRSKIAVASNEENIDPVGSCVGQRGTRVQTIINELGGEKIDIIEWSEDIEAFISNALSPAKVIGIKLDEKNQTAKVSVKEDQLSLAIGKNGQNVRLAAKLTGWKIDIEGAGKVAEPKEETSDNQQDTNNTQETNDQEKEEKPKTEKSKEEKKDESAKTEKLDKKSKKEKKSSSAKATEDKEKPKDEKKDDEKKDKSEKKKPASPKTASQGKEDEKESDSEKESKTKEEPKKEVKDKKEEDAKTQKDEDAKEEKK